MNWVIILNCQSGDNILAEVSEHKGLLWCIIRVRHYGIYVLKRVRRKGEDSHWSLGNWVNVSSRETILMAWFPAITWLFLAHRWSCFRFFVLLIEMVVVIWMGAGGYLCTAKTHRAFPDIWWWEVYLRWEFTPYRRILALHLHSLEILQNVWINKRGRRILALIALTDEVWSSVSQIQPL